MGKRQRSGVVVNGRRRIVHDEIERIRRELRERYAAELSEAGFLRRLLIRLRIRKEIQTRLEEVAPSRGLYTKR